MQQRSHLGSEVWGGVSAMLVALPSAIAFGVTIFAPLGGSYAARGAIAGILGTVALGLVAPALGGTDRLITAPCAPAAAVLSALAIQLAASGTAPETPVLMIGIVVLITAFFQITFGAIGLGRGGQSERNGARSRQRRLRRIALARLRLLRSMG